MLVRRTLQVALVALVAAAVLTIFWNIGLGIEEPSPGTVFMSYVRWGRWAEVAMIVLFASLLVVAPLLPRAKRAAHVIVSGVVIAIIGDLIDLSEFPGPGLIDLFSANAIPIDFVAGRAFQFSTQSSPNYVWAAGILLVGVGMFILSVDAEDRTWSRASLILGIAFSLVALTDINVDTAVASWIASWIAMGILFNWLLVTLRVTGRPHRPTSRASERSPTAFQ
jgi:hypothetical protein